ncbi:MAG: HAMP domain-containing protein [Chloroflexaceae bacterium]|nr:HAMP domain-containing protein [Chloroflexaceae bacterium]
MQKVIQEVQTRLHYKIILPFILLTLFVALVGYAIAFYLIAGAEQERFNNNVVEAARVASLAVVDQERANLQFLIELVFAPRNELTGAPAVAQAIREDDTDGLRQALEPYFQRGMNRDTVQLDRLIAFNRTGYSMVDLERAPPGTTDTGFVVNPGILRLDHFEPVHKIVNEVHDNLGDKYAGIMLLDNPTDPQSDYQYYFGTVAPVIFDEQLVGGIMIAMRVDQLAEKLLMRASADSLAFHTMDGDLLVWAIRDGDTAVSTIKLDDSPHMLDIADTGDHPLLTTIKETNQERGVILDTRNRENVQYGYARLDIRSMQVGILSCGLSRSRMTDWDQARLPLIGTTVVLVLGIVGVGFFISRQITIPLDELVSTAREVTSGNYERRSQVTSRDEIGMLSSAFNQMTEHLVDLLQKVRADSVKREAIVQSIPDGLIVCQATGEIETMNRAMYDFLGVKQNGRAILPGRFHDLPLTRDEKAFGARSRDMYVLGEHSMRLMVSQIVTAEGHYLGDVYVLQDMTDEVKVDRMKSDFIRTVSHEMRTPLTSIRGNADMLIAGLAGPLQSEQHSMVQTMSQQTSNMSRLLENMVAISGIESGTTKVELEPTDLKQAVEEAIWPLRKAVKAKKLSLTTDIPPDIPQVDADRIHLRMIMKQLIDNARVYTEEGGITVRATHQPDDRDFVQIDVIDTGCGIAPDLIGRVFERLVRGEQSNDRPDRGIGLGLTIAQLLVESQGGQIWVTSTPGSGSTFSFTLRCAHEKDPEEQPVVEAA